MLLGHFALSGVMLLTTALGTGMLEFACSALALALTPIETLPWVFKPAVTAPSSDALCY